MKANVSVIDRVKDYLCTQRQTFNFLKKRECFSLNFFHDSFPYCKRRVCLTLHPAYLSRFRVVSDEGWANYTRGERKHEARRTDLASRAGNSVSNETTCSLAWRVIVLWVDVWKGEQLVIFDWVLRASSASCLDLLLINCYEWRLANVVHVNFDGQHSIKTHVCSAMAGFSEYHSSPANHSKRIIRFKFFCQIWSGFEAVLSLVLAILIQQSNNYNHKNALMRGRKNSMHRGKELLVARFEVFES